jgi:hypothetical protein
MLRINMYVASIELASGANATIASYIAMCSLVRFENKNTFFYYEKRSSLA